MVNKSLVLSKLPDYSDNWVKVVENQDVEDIISLIIARHYDFAGDYDNIGPLFEGRTLDDTCDNLVNFCLANIQYKAEGKDRQTVGSPQAILSRGRGDCKHFASFIGGCLDAISRATGQEINWCYCFASYDILEPTPYHVFVIVEDEQGPQYLDPTPGTDKVEPVYMTKEYVFADTAGTAVNGLGEMVSMGDTAANTWGDVIPAPHWYDSTLPKFYRASNGQIHLHPLNSVPKYTTENILDLLLYYQTIIGYNRTDSADGYRLTGAARSAAWTAPGGWSAYVWAQSAFKSDARGDGSGDWANIPTTGMGIDGALYAQLQARYITNEAATMPWLADMQAKGGGIDLTTIPMATDKEIPRPAFLPKYLPSLFISAGLPYQWPAGSMNTKPKIRGGRSSGYTEYIPTAQDVAALLMYAQPVIALGPSPYPTLWYINDNVNGAQASFFKISAAISDALGHSNAQEQAYGFVGDMMKIPDLDADPYSSGFSRTLEGIVQYVFSYYTSKIPGGTQLTTAAKTAAAAGGYALTGGQEPPPEGTFTNAVFKAAKDLQTQLDDESKTQTMWVIALLALAGLAYYYEDDINKFFK